MKVFTCPYCGQQEGIIEVEDVIRGNYLTKLHLVDDSYVDYYLDERLEELRHSEVIHFECMECGKVLVDELVEDGFNWVITSINDLEQFFEEQVTKEDK